MGVIVFNPDRQALHVAGRAYVLDLKLRPDGTGIARILEADRSGRLVLLAACLRYDPRQAWRISTPVGSGTGRTPREAAIRALTPFWARAEAVDRH